LTKLLYHQWLQTCQSIEALRLQSLETTIPVLRSMILYRGQSLWREKGRVSVDMSFQIPLEFRWENECRLKSPSRRKAKRLNLIHSKLLLTSCFLFFITLRPRSPCQLVDFHRPLFVFNSNIRNVRTLSPQQELPPSGFHFGVRISAHLNINHRPFPKRKPYIPVRAG